MFGKVLETSLASIAVIKTKPFIIVFKKTSLFNECSIP